MMQDIIMAGELVNEKLKPLGLSIQCFMQKYKEISHPARGHRPLV